MAAAGRRELPTPDHAGRPPSVRSRSVSRSVARPGSPRRRSRVALRPREQVAHDQQRPALADEVEGAGQGTVLLVGAPGHGASATRRVPRKQSVHLDNLVRCRSDVRPRRPPHVHAPEVGARRRGRVRRDGDRARRQGRRPAEARRVHRSRSGERAGRRRAAAAIGHDPLPGVVVVARPRQGGNLHAPAARAEIQRLARVLAADPEVAVVRTPFDRGRRRSWSRATAARS